MNQRKFTMTDFLYDAFLYHNYPKWLPIVYSAVAFASFFVVLYFQMYDLYGLGVVGMIVWTESKVAQLTILSGSSRRSCGFAWGIILTVVSSYYIHFACSSAKSASYQSGKGRPEGGGEGGGGSAGEGRMMRDEVSITATVVGTCFSLAIVYTLLATMNTPPSSLPRNSPNKEDSEARCVTLMRELV